MDKSEGIDLTSQSRGLVMLKKPYTPPTNLTVLFVIFLAVLSLRAAERHTLIINGQSSEVPVIFVSGRPYVGLEAFAKAVNGSVSSSGVVVVLNLPSSPADHAPSPTIASAAPERAPTQSAPSNLGFSREFLNAGIEQMATLREWHTALQTAIEGGIPLSEALLQPYRAQANKNLHLASVAAATTADRNAYQLLNNVYLNMAKLSDKYVNMRASLTYIAPDALENDELNRRIISCGHFLGAMASSGQFSDDGSCH
jgi:hypothetical protein